MQVFPQMNCATATQALPRFNQPLVDLVLTQLDEKQIPYERVEAWKYFGSPCVLAIPERNYGQEIIVVLQMSSTDPQSADVLDALMEVLAYEWDIDMVLLTRMVIHFTDTPWETYDFSNARLAYLEGKPIDTFFHEGLRY